MRVLRMVFVLMLFAAAPLMAQHAGFRTAGIPVTPFVASPVGPFIAAPVTPFGMAPIQVAPIVIGGQVGTVFNPGFAIPGFSQPIVPNFVVNYPGSFYGPQQVIAPGYVIIPGAVIAPTTTVVIAQPQVPRAHFGPVTVRAHGPASGTPRERVIREFGPPITSVITQSGETITFRNGVTVHIQNGQVAGRR